MQRNSKWSCILIATFFEYTNTKEKVHGQNFFIFQFFGKIYHSPKKICIIRYSFIGIYRFPIQSIVTARRLKIYLLTQIEMKSKPIYLIFNIITPKFTLFASNLSTWQGEFFFNKWKSFPIIWYLFIGQID